jgi:hypothetical protein
MQKIHFRDDRADQKLNKKIHISNPGLIREDSILFSDQATLPIIPSVVLYESIRVLYTYTHTSSPSRPKILDLAQERTKESIKFRNDTHGMHAVMS